VRWATDYSKYRRFLFFPFICLSVCLSVPIYLSFYLSICLFVSVYLPSVFAKREQLWHATVWVVSLASALAFRRQCIGPAFVACLVYSKPKVKFTHRMNHKEHKRKKWHWRQCTTHNCDLSQCILIWSTLFTGHEHVMLWFLCHHCQCKGCSRTPSILFICLPIYLSPSLHACLSICPSNLPTTHPSIRTCACLPAVSSFSCHAVCLPVHLFILFFFPFCFERNRNSSVSIVTRLSAGRVRNL
jgi:hypothetical protein